MGFGLLSVSIWLPIAIGIVLLALGRDDNPAVARWFALGGSVASFLVTLPLISGFDKGTAALQFQENLPWIERFNVRYHLGVDGISVWFVLLTAFVSVIVVSCFPFYKIEPSRVTRTPARDRTGGGPGCAVHGLLYDRHSPEAAACGKSWTRSLRTTSRWGARASTIPSSR